MYAFLSRRERGSKGISAFVAGVKSRLDATILVDFSSGYLMAHGSRAGGPSCLYPKGILPKLNNPQAKERTMRRTATNPRWMILPLLLTLSCAGLPAFGQQNETDIQIGKSVVVQSKVLNRDLRISVYLPSNYATSGIKYPVLYDPNDFLFKYDAGTVELLSIMSFIPPMIVVGTPGFQNGYVPTAFEQRSAQPTAADLTLKFFREELIPFVEKNYRAQNFRILCSHSVGGLFTMYALFTQPDLFSAYIASSPWFQTNDQYWLKNIDKMFRAESLQNKTLFMTVGRDEADLTRKTYSDLEKWMNTRDLKGLRWKSAWFDGVDHGSMVGKSLYDGLLFVFEGWRIPDSILTSGDIAKIEGHGKEMARKFSGIDLPPIPENRLNALGYRFINEKAYDKAIDVLRYNIKLYPNSPNTYDSLGEAYLTKGDRENAAKYYKLAVEKNPGNTENEKRILQSSKSKLKELGIEIK
jgi:predicted alpha/beta superfamily hydrolase